MSVNEDIFELLRLIANDGGAGVLTDDSDGATFLVRVERATVWVPSEGVLTQYTDEEIARMREIVDGHDAIAGLPE